MKEELQAKHLKGMLGPSQAEAKKALSEVILTDCTRSGQISRKLHCALNFGQSQCTMISNESLHPAQRHRVSECPHCWLLCNSPSIGDLGVTSRCFRKLRHIPQRRDGPTQVLSFIIGLIGSFFTFTGTHLGPSNSQRDYRAAGNKWTPQCSSSLEVC